jgi:ATP-binding cassette subfamily G (WHITE) protein 2 (SNQ2)
MYRLSPYTYLVEGLLGQAIGRQEINCSPVEFVSVTPPTGLTCGEYLNPFMSRAGGYLANPDATSACQFCSTRTTDQFLEGNFNIFYDHRWRNVGLMFVFCAFNVSRISFLVDLHDEAYDDDYLGFPHLLPDLHVQD